MRSVGRHGRPRPLRYELPSIVQRHVTVLPAEDNDVVQCRVIGDAGAFTRWRRLSRTQLSPIATNTKPFPCAVLVYTTASTAEENHCMQVWIECSGAGVHTGRLSWRSFQSPCRAVVGPGIDRINGSETTKQNYLASASICRHGC